MAQDEQFRESPAARLLFFEQRAPSWDEKMNLVPVFRVAPSLNRIRHAAA